MTSAIHHAQFTSAVCLFAFCEKCRLIKYNSLIANESAPIPLAHCWFPVLAISTATTTTTTPVSQEAGTRRVKPVWI